MREIWKDVVGYEGYRVSSLGNVSSKKSPSKNLRPLGATQPYFKVRLYKYGFWHSVPVHRLVALAFITNPKNKPQVNHKDGNKKNNNFSNLEWCTASENCKHRVHSLGIRPKGKKKRALIAFNEVKQIRFASIFDAEKSGFTITAIYRSMKPFSGRHTHKGYKWRYA